MANQNITKLIRQVHEEEQSKRLIKKVLEESEEGFPESLLEQVRSLVQKSEESGKNIITFPGRKIQLAQTELMAAAGQNLGDWFAQPIVFTALGMVVDIRKILGTDDEVDVYIYSNDGEQALMEEAFLQYRDSSLKVSLTVGDKELLNANIYVDECGQSAEGTGHLYRIEEDVHGKLNLNILIGK